MRELSEWAQPASEEERGRVPRSWWITLAVLAVAVLAGTLLGVQLYRTRGLDLFGPAGGSFGAVGGPGETILFDAIGANESHDVVVDELRPHLVSNSGHGTVRYVMCRLRDAGHSFGSGDTSHIRGICAASAPFRPGVSRLTPTPSGADEYDLVLMQVTLQRKGSIDIEDTKIRYRQGDRHGDQFAGSSVEVASSKPLSRFP